MHENVGRYSILKLLGRGAMGAVYLAADPILNRQVAIKMVDLAVEEESQRSFLRDRLLRDAKAAALLSHPNIVGIYDVIEEDATAYVVMEYVAGENLASYLDQNPAPDGGITLQVLRQMASALDYTHSKGIIHRDIKPGNVMRDPNGVTKILDFGIARLSDGLTSTPTGMVMGTIEYMSPEQVKGDTLDGRSDQFSLAAVAYRMLTGSTLFGQHTLATIAYKVVNEMPPPPTGRNSSLPLGVDRVLMRGLAKSPSDRFRSCSEFAEAVAQVFLGGMEAPASGVPASETSAPSQAIPDTPTVVTSKKKSGLKALLAAACLVFAATLLLVWRPWSRPAESLKSDAAKTVSIVQPAQTGSNSSPPPVVQQNPVKQTGSNVNALDKSPNPIGAPDSLPKSETRNPVKPPKTNSARPIDSGEVERLYRSGQQQLKSGDFAGAIGSFTAVIAVNPGFRKAYHQRGYAYQLAYQTEAAIQDYSRAIQLDSQDAMSYSDRAVCRVRIRQEDQALADFNRALELRPDLAAALNGRGGILLRHRDYAQAIRNFDAALGSNPKFALAYENRARTKRALGDNAGADADFRRFKELKANRTEP